MIYAPDTFVFIHIPRAGGTSITQALAATLVGRRDVMVNTVYLPGSGWDKHATAAELKTVIPDWDSIKKFAVRRATRDIIDSDWRMQRRTPDVETEYNDAWNESVAMAKAETLEEFRQRRWIPWIGEKSAWEHWTGDEDVTPIGFSDLRAGFRKLLVEIGLPGEAITLDHLNIGNWTGPNPVTIS